MAAAIRPHSVARSPAAVVVAIRFIVAGADAHAFVVTIAGTGASRR
jgi:hypothetical protein